ncbi:MAG: CBS domain-containing protein [Gemmatimonadetes bacterium]|nr:CBS domain-containing protein [Gemmatimonadota bacterium]
MDKNGVSDVLARTVGAILQRDVVTIDPDATIRDLARLLAEKGVSGVPVVNQGGCVLGVVSATDVVRFAARLRAPVGPGPWWEREGAAAEAEMVEAVPYFTSPDDAIVFLREVLEQLSVDAFDECTVREILSPVRFAVHRETTVLDLARFLVRARIHRALVLDGGELAGIVTTLDVLRAVADASPG